jgi:hypothetical protein
MHVSIYQIYLILFYFAFEIAYTDTQIKSLRSGIMYHTQVGTKGDGGKEGRKDLGEEGITAI